MKGNTSMTTLIGITLVTSIIYNGGTWFVTHVLDSPAQAETTLTTQNTRIITLETKQKIQEKYNLNQSNKTDYLIQAVYKIANKLDVEVGNPPVNQ